MLAGRRHGIFRTAKRHWESLSKAGACRVGGRREESSGLDCRQSLCARLEPLTSIDVREILFFSPSWNTDRGVSVLGKRFGCKPSTRNESNSERSPQGVHLRPTWNFYEMFEFKSNADDPKDGEL